MLATLLQAIPLAGVWMVVTSHISLDSFLVGALLGVAIQLLLRTESRCVEIRCIPDQIVAVLVYVVTLGRDVMLSAFDVARRVLHPDLPLNPGILAVSTQLCDENDVIAAFSAHGITLTPGELVLDFEGCHTMYVHTLDVHATAQNAHGQQTKRLELLHRIMAVKA